MSDLDALYGASRSAWVFCHRCDQAIPLEELATTARYSAENGWAHEICPSAGTAPCVEGAERHHTPPRRWDLD